MAARPRDRQRRDWPTGLRERRPGYFTWVNPKDGKEIPIGRVSLAHAKQQVNAALDYLQAQEPTLLERLTGAGNTVAQLLDKMPVPANKNTAKTHRSLHKKIRDALGDVPCLGLSVRHCAELIEAEAEAGKDRSAQALRSRLIAVCKKGMALGWLESNPADSTEAQAVKVKRGRLTLEMFRAVLAKAPEVNEWLRGAMLLALVSGQDRSTVAGMRRSHIGPEFLTVRRGKTRVWIEIPLTLRLDAIEMTLREALAACQSDVRSLREDWVVHHARVHGNAPLGSAIHVNLFSRAFTEARVLAGIPDTLPDGKGAPTFHEIRSLAKRLYKAQGGVDSKALLGHLTEDMSELYADPRGAEPIRVTLG